MTPREQRDKLIEARELLIEVRRQIAANDDAWPLVNDAAIKVLLAIDYIRD